MATEKKIGSGTLKVVKDDITMLEVEAFVFYTQPDLQLGSGYGNAISTRGGPAIQKELDEIGQAKVTEIVVTSGGKLKAKHILHAVGPAFQEPDMNAKLESTTINALKKAEQQGASKVALPAMGAGFYGVPLPESARITIAAIEKHMSNGGKLEQIILCLNDNRELKAFEAAVKA
jgi:O-acetyl-ADP-ribose deacetylase (regulator of RNase III)